VEITLPNLIFFLLWAKNPQDDAGRTVLQHSRNEGKIVDRAADIAVDPFYNLARFVYDRLYTINEIRRNTLRGRRLEPFKAAGPMSRAWFSSRPLLTAARQSVRPVRAPNKVLLPAMVGRPCVPTGLYLA